jgi:hypothetical protein
MVWCKEEIHDGGAQRSLPAAEGQLQLIKEPGLSDHPLSIPIKRWKTRCLMSWPSKKAGSDPLLWGRNSISDVIADARASLQQPSRPFTPRNLTQVSVNLCCSLALISFVH